MSEEIKKCPNCGTEIKDDELDQVAGGWTAEEERESVIKATQDGSCKIERYNRIYGPKQ